MLFQKTMFSRLAVIAALSFFPTVSATADSLSGSYLSGNLANLDNDYEAAARYYARALALDPENPYLLQNALLAEIGRGDIDAALGFAKLVKNEEQGGQLTQLVLLTDAVKRRDFTTAKSILALETDNFSPLLHGLLLGWVELGAGNMSGASAQFDSLKKPEALALFGQYHKALTLATAGDFEGADRILAGDENGNLRLNRGSLIAHAQILSQLDRGVEAIKILEDATAGSNDRQLLDLAKAIGEGPVDYDFIVDATQGSAEVFFTLAGALQGEDGDRFALIYSRLAEYLRPDMVGSFLLTGEILRDQGQFELANQSYAKVDQDHPMFIDAELGRSDSLLDANKPDAAIEVLRGLTRSHSTNPRVHMTLGDALRGEERYAEATASYDTAVELLASPQRNQWFLYYARAITHEREGNWDQAEIDFRTALELNPGQPLVLNYLGYSLVEKGMKIEEAQKMIEDAVKARPDDGYIADSLGWVLFTQGKFNDALGPMEQAIELVPDDPIINDHLGDVYWMVGRKREAEFQWRRALSFDPEGDEAVRIRAKLETGLDAVMAQEAAMKNPQGNGDN